MSGVDHDLLSRAIRLKTILVSRARGEAVDEAEFQTLRQYIVTDDRIRVYLPDFLRYCRTLGEFWRFICGEFSGTGSYKKRQQLLDAAFDPLLTLLEQGFDGPGHAAISATLQTVGSTHVRDAWGKALDRRISDPDGAITSARALLESTCKHILDETNTPYSEKDDLPALYYRTAQQLHLAPDQQTDMGLRRLLGNAQAVVQELGALRNKIGDAHGKGKDGATAAVRHAQLAVNLAGALATFLIATWEDQQPDNPLPF